MNFLDTFYSNDFVGFFSYMINSIDTFANYRSVLYV